MPRDACLTVTKLQSRARGGRGGGKGGVGEREGEATNFVGLLAHRDRAKSAAEVAVSASGSSLYRIFAPAIGSRRLLRTASRSTLATCNGQVQIQPPPKRLRDSGDITAMCLSARARALVGERGRCDSVSHRDNYGLRFTVSCGRSSREEREYGEDRSARTVYIAFRRP